MTLEELNSLPAERAREEFFRCCGSSLWAQQMSAARPYTDREALFLEAQRRWAELGREDRLEAFRQHPRIGEEQIRERFGSTASWASQEQAGVKTATEQVLAALAQGNRDYEERFGHIFLICATGKTASEILEQLRSRLANEPGREFEIACGEQAKITRIRLEKLLS